MYNQKLFFSIFLLILITITIPLIAQEEEPPPIRWVRYYQSNEHQGRTTRFYDVFPVRDGGYVFGGSVFDRVNHHNGWLLVTLENGNVTLDINYDFGEARAHGKGNSVIKTDDGGYLMGGRTQHNRNNFDIIKSDEDGEMEWWEVYAVGWGSWSCRAVIELKDGGFAAAGQNNSDRECYIVRLDADGDVLWENIYGSMNFNALREVEGEGLIVAGFGGNSNGLVIKTDYDGEVIWERSHIGGPLYDLVSCPTGGFAACGGASNNQGFRLIRINDEGELEWSNNFELLDGGGSTIAYSLAVMPDQGFVMAGITSGDRGEIQSGIVRTDAEGNLRWQRTHDELPNEPVLATGRAKDYQSVIVKEDGSIYLAGRSGRRDIMNEYHGEAVLLCLEPDHSPPYIVEFHPEMHEFSVLPEDTVTFWVYAEDMQNDELSYIWTLDMEEVAADTFWTIQFEELGDFRVKCVVSDGEQADSTQWLVHVEEFYIESYAPDSLSWTIQRDREIDFSLDVRAIEGLEPYYRWILTDRAGRNNDISEEAEVSHHFDLAGNFGLEGRTYHEGIERSVFWRINVNSLLYWWMPHEREFTIPIGEPLEFTVIPFEPMPDSLEFMWFIDGFDEEIYDVGLYYTFRDTGEHSVVAIVYVGAEADTVIWTVRVYDPNDVSDDPASLLPSEVTLYPAAPNPFNSTTSIRYFLPTAGEVRLSIYDSAGRLVQTLSDGWQIAGDQRASMNGADLAAGVYLLRLEVGSVVKTGKVVLLK